MRLLRRLISLLLVAVLLVVGFTAFRIWTVARADQRGKVDAIVVLGASQFDGRPSEVFQARLDHAASLFRAGVAPRVVTLGGSQPSDRYTEAAAGQLYLAKHGVAAGQVIVIGTGTDTLQSITALAAAMKQHRWRTAVLVTDPWHEARSRRMASDKGITATTSPARTGPAVATRGTEARYIARETAAYLYYRVFHRSSDSGPRAV